MARVGETLALAAFAAAIGLAVPVAMTMATAHAQQTAEKPERPKPAKKTAKKKGGDADAEGDKKDAKKARDPAEVEKLLAAAQKSLETGKAEIAGQQIDVLVNGGGLTSRAMARALMIRGEAYRKQGKPAQAIADLQSALWLKGGLNETERTQATNARAGAYREAGLGEPPPGPETASRTTSKPPPPAPAAPHASTPANTAPVVTAAVPAPPSPAAPPPAPRVAEAQSAPENPVGNFFSNLFSGSGETARKPAPAPKAAPPTRPEVSSYSEPDPRKSDALAAKGREQKPLAKSAKIATASTHAKTAPAKAAADADGRFVLRLAAQRTAAEAQTLGQSMKAKHASALGDRGYDVDQATFGNMGTFYRANLGPFADQKAAEKLCATLRGEGVDCQVVTR